MGQPDKGAKRPKPQQDAADPGPDGCHTPDPVATERSGGGNAQRGKANCDPPLWAIFCIFIHEIGKKGNGCPARV